MTDQLIVYAIGLLGIFGCWRFVVADNRLMRRRQMLTSTGATRLLDGERFAPPALTDYEEATCDDDSRSAGSHSAYCLMARCFAPAAASPTAPIATRDTSQRSRTPAHQTPARRASA